MAKNQAAVSLGRRGGTARAKNLTPAERKDSARRAAQARWAKRHDDMKEILKAEIVRQQPKKSKP
jgi:hypothetical protein